MFNRRPAPSEVGGQLVAQLERLNTNFERWLEHVGARRLASVDAPVLDDRTYVGEALSEVEQALKEHAESLGMEWKPNGND